MGIAEYHLSILNGTYQYRYYSVIWCKKTWCEKMFQVILLPMNLILQLTNASRQTEKQKTS